jgi:hypothetical protein
MKLGPLTNVSFHWPWEYTGPWPYIYQTRAQMLAEMPYIKSHFCIAWTFATPFFQVFQHTHKCDICKRDGL